MLLRPDSLLLFENYPNVHILFYGINNKKAVHQQHKRMTVLQLISSRILRLTPSWNEKQKTHLVQVDLAHSKDDSCFNDDGDGDFVCNLDSAWNSINLKEEEEQMMQQS